MNKVKVKSGVGGTIGINVPEIRLSRTWEKKGAIKEIDLEQLQEAIYEPGVQYMFEQGILIIDDMEAKIALGLEEEGTKEPTNIIVLTEEQKKRYMTALPITEFRKKVKELPYEQAVELAQYAIENSYASIDKVEVLKKITDIDVLKAIQLKRANEEKVDAPKED